MVAIDTACKYHPERPGVGICVKCRTVVCTECSTRFDGINHCAVCVAHLKAEAELVEIGPNRGLLWLGLASLSVVLAAGSYATLHMLLLW